MPLSTSKFRQDITKAWFQLTEDIEVQLSRFDPRSPAYAKIHTRNVAPVKKLVDKNLLPEAKDLEIAIATAVEHCVHNWRTVLNRDENGIVTDTRNAIEDAPGEWHEFTLENAVRIFKKYPTFYFEVIEYARDIANFQLGEEERKNLPSA